MFKEKFLRIKEIMKYVFIFGLIFSINFLNGCRWEGDMSTYAFQNIKKVTFYEGNNMNLETKAVCDLDNLRIKGEIKNKLVLEKMFGSVVKVKTPLATYDPGFGVIALEDGAEIRIVTNSLNGTFYVIYPQSLKGIYKPDQVTAQEMFSIQIRRQIA